MYTRGSKFHSHVVTSADETEYATTYLPATDRDHRIASSFLTKCLIEVSIRLTARVA